LTESPGGAGAPGAVVAASRVLAVLIAATLAVLAADPLWSGAAEESVVLSRLAAESVSRIGYAAERIAGSGTRAAQALQRVGLTDLSDRLVDQLPAGGAGGWP
ncbi:MAG: hypothetical protein ACRDVZ_14395, partial [Jiangellaceae bacterium]